MQTADGTDMAMNRFQIDAGLARIAYAAARGERCPTNRSAENPAGELLPGVTTALIKDGRIRVEVYAHNWRVVEILKGPHAGKRTAPPPYKYATKPYLILPRPDHALSSPDHAK